MKINRQIRAYFIWSHRQRLGVLTILGLILVELIIHWWISIQPPPDRVPDRLAEDVAAFLASEQFAEELESKSSDSIIEPQLFYFNPNKLPEADWKKLGLGDRLIKTIKNYEAKGGAFYKASDLKKIYGMNDMLFNKLAPYIDIPKEDRPIKPLPKPKPFEVKPKPIVDLNHADSVSLLSLKGIGPWYAGKILKYRERLGGFVRKEQLLELYRFDTARLSEIESRLVIDTSSIEYLNLNKAAFKQLLHHPYFNFNQVRAIVNYREQHGKYATVEELLKIDIIDQSTLDRISPYLKVED